VAVPIGLRGGKASAAERFGRFGQRLARPQRKDFEIWRSVKQPLGTALLPTLPPPLTHAYELSSARFSPPTCTDVSPCILPLPPSAMQAPSAKTDSLPSRRRDPSPPPGLEKAPSAGSPYVEANEKGVKPLSTLSVSPGAPPTHTLLRVFGPGSRNFSCSELLVFSELLGRDAYDVSRSIFMSAEGDLLTCSSFSPTATLVSRRHSRPRSDSSTLLLLRSATANFSGFSLGRAVWDGRSTTSGFKVSPCFFQPSKSKSRRAACRQSFRTRRSLSLLFLPLPASSARRELPCRLSSSVSPVIFSTCLLDRRRPAFSLGG
jgi:hypothetical protein